MFELLSEIPFVSLFIKFMVASTVLLGAVWLMEKFRLITSPDLAEQAWKAAIVGSFIALIPVADFMTSTVVVESQRTANFINSLDQGRPFSELAAPGRIVTNEVVTEPPEQSQTTVPQPEVPFPVPAAPLPSRAISEGETAASKALEVARVAVSEAAASHRDNHSHEQTAGIAGDPEVFVPEGDSEIITELTFWQSAAILRTTDLAALGWVALAGLALSMLIVSYRSAVRNLGSRVRVQAEDNANRVLRAICEQADIRHVPYLSRSSDLKSPVCLPRKEICLPDWAFDAMPEEEFKSLLAHELGHMVRKDPIMLMALQVLSRTFFFQPLFILARKRLTDIAELAADEWAAKQAADSRAVANALFICATKIHETRQIQWGLAMAGNKSILKRRVERLISTDSASFKTTSTFAKSALAVGVVGLGLGLPSVEFAGAHPHDENYEERYVGRLPGGVLPEVERLKELERLAAIGGVSDELSRELAVVGSEIGSSIGDSVSTIVNEAMALAEHELVSAGHDNFIFHGFDGQESGNFNWHEDDYSVSVNWEGSFRIADNDDTLIAEDDYGFVRIKTKDGGEKRLIKFEADEGKTKVSYYKGGKKQELDKDGKAWLKRTIGKMIQSGFGAEARVARILKKDGVKGALAEVKKLTSDFAKRIYISQIVSEAKLKDREVGQVIDIVSKMGSDFEKRLTLSELLDEEKVGDKYLSKVLAVAKKFDSDFEKRLLVTAYVDELKLTDKSIKAVIEIADSMDSDFEIRLLLTAALDDAKLNDKNIEKIVDIATRKIDSDFELRILLTTFVDHFKKSDRAIAKALTAIEKMDSSFEKRLLLSSIVDEAKLNEVNWLLAIEAVDTIDSDHERYLVLMQMKDEIPEKNKKVSAALEEAMKDVKPRYYGMEEEERRELQRELAEELREAAQEREEAIREAMRELREDKRFIQRQQARALREVERELSRLKRDQSRAEGQLQRELARAVQHLERTKRELERAFSKENKVVPDEPEKVI